MAVRVNFQDIFTYLVNGNKFLICKSGRVKEIIDEIAGEYPIFREKVFDKNGNLKSYLSIFIGNKNINKLSGINTIAKDDQIIKIYIAIMGG